MWAISHFWWYSGGWLVCSRSVDSSLWGVVFDIYVVNNDIQYYRDLNLLAVFSYTVRDK